MKMLKRAMLSVMSLLPFQAIAFAASEELSMDVPVLNQRSKRLAHMYDAQFFSPEFYEQMKSVGIQKGADLYQIQDKQIQLFVRDAVKAEIIQLGLSGSPSPM